MCSRADGRYGQFKSFLRCSFWLVSDRTLIALGVLAMAAAGVILGSLGADWAMNGRPSLVTMGIRIVAAMAVYAAGLYAWAKR